MRLSPLARRLLQWLTTSASAVVPVDDGFDYSVSISCGPCRFATRRFTECCSSAAHSIDSEIYNEKIYDLLDSPLPTPAPSAAAASAANGGGGMFKGLFRNFTTVKRSALSLKADKSAAAAAQGQKVVNGLREVEVASAEVCAQRLKHGSSQGFSRS